MENELQWAEEQYWSGMVAHNFEQVKGLTQFPCLIAGSNGLRSVDETSFKKMFDSHKGIQMKASDLSNVQSRMLNGHIGVIMYEIELGYDGESRLCVCTSTWQKTGDKWKCVMHSETPLQKHS